MSQARSFVPPPLHAGLSGWMSSHPTLPEVVEQSGMIDSFNAVGLAVTLYGPPAPNPTWELGASHKVKAVGKVAGMKPQAWSEEQISSMAPAIAVASAEAVKPLNPAILAKNVPNAVDPPTCTP